MGYSISCIDKYGEEAAYYHYPESDKDRPLHRVLKVTIKDNNKKSKVFSIGDLLQAQSELMNITGSIGEQDFIQQSLLAIKDTHVKNILIVFN